MLFVVVLAQQSLFLEHEEKRKLEFFEIKQMLQIESCAPFLSQPSALEKAEEARICR